MKNSNTSRLPLTFLIMLQNFCENKAPGLSSQQALSTYSSLSLFSSKAIAQLFKSIVTLSFSTRKSLKLLQTKQSIRDRFMFLTYMQHTLIACFEVGETYPTDVCSASATHVVAARPLLDRRVALGAVFDPKLPLALSQFLFVPPGNLVPTFRTRYCGMRVVA